jgi:hypothetical protein
MKVSSEAASIVGGAAMLALGLGWLRLLAKKKTKKKKDEKPRGLGCVSGPYVMRKRIQKGRNQ